PTQNRTPIASKGSLRVQLTAAGRMAHSAYPQLGDSAINKLVEALHQLQQMKLPSDPEIGPCTMNVGVIEGGRAPNVIADHARARLLYRLVGPAEQLRREIVETVGDLATVEYTLEILVIRRHTFERLPTLVAAFTPYLP